MTVDTIWASRSALEWVQFILQDRFGHAFTLQLQPDNTLRIWLGPAAPCIELPLDIATFIRSDSDLPCTQWNAAAEGWQAALDPILPAPGANALQSPLIEPTALGYRIHYDILGLTYWMLSRQEEVGRTDLDSHGRFPATSSHAYKHGYLERPIVDEWLYVLGKVIQRTWPGIALKRHMFSMKVSHDVDGPSRYAFLSWPGIARAMAGDLLKRRDFSAALRAPWISLTSGDRLHPADPANTFDWIMDMSERHGMTSAFYFICGRTAPQLDADYEPEHPAIRALMRQIHQRGHVIGLHPSYNTYQTTSAIVAEAKRLRAVAESEGIRQAEWGGRMHFLRWEHPTTLRAWDEAGMDYDSTLSYADHPGFRSGTCFEYPAFDPVAKAMLKLRVRPLVAMECTVMAPHYLGLGTGQMAFAKFKQLKEACRAVNGCFTLLWHNTQFETEQKRRLYRDVIKE